MIGYILSGGKNKRMNGEVKFFLTIDGQTFGSRVAKSLDELDEICLSVDDPDLYQAVGLTCVKDEISGAGPMAGIVSGLKRFPESPLLVVPCDMPFITKDSVKALIRNYEKRHFLTIAAINGRTNPLFAIYPPRVLPVLEKLISEGKSDPKAILEEAMYQMVPVQDELCGIDINTPEEYQKISQLAAESMKSDECAKKRAFMYGITGAEPLKRKELILDLLKELEARGRRAAVLTKVKDSILDSDYFEAGAVGQGRLSADGFSVKKKSSSYDISKASEIFQDADIIILDNFEDTAYPGYEIKDELSSISAKELADRIEMLILMLRN